MGREATKTVLKREQITLTELSGHEAESWDVHPDSEEIRTRIPRYTLETAFSSVPALPDRESSDFDELIDEAMEAHATWVVDRMRRGLE